MKHPTKHRLLVVEDNPMNMEMLCDWLESENFQVQSAENLHDAREAFQRETPDVVLLDIRLGTEDGLDFARWVRKESGFGQVPVIAVTAHALSHEHQRILQEGCNSVVSKPVDFRVLSKQLEMWLRACA